MKYRGKTFFFFSLKSLHDSLTSIFFFFKIASTCQEIIYLLSFGHNNYILWKSQILSSIIGLGMEDLVIDDKQPPTKYTVEKDQTSSF